jgi:hypothetical protein
MSTPRGILFFIEKLANELDCEIEEAMDLMAEALEDDVVDLRFIEPLGNA